MGIRQFTGQGAGFGIGIGCGFGVGWGFGGGPIGIAGLGVGGGCGVGGKTNLDAYGSLLHCSHVLDLLYGPHLLIGGIKISTNKCSALC